MKESRLYSMFEKQADGTFKRVSELSYKKSDAIRIFQTALLDGAMGYRPVCELRVVKNDKPIKVSEYFQKKIDSLLDTE